MLRWEWRLMSREPAFWLGALVLIVLLLGSAHHQQSLLRDLNQDLDQHLASFQERRENSTELLAQVERGEKSYDSMWDDPRGYFLWHRGSVPFPLGDMAFWATGQRDLFAPTNDLSIFSPIEIKGNEIANPVPHMFGSFDPAFVWVYLLPLWFIALTYNFVSADRERGSLRMLCAQPISAFKLYMARLAIRYGVTMVVVCVMLLICFLIAGFSPELGQSLGLLLPLTLAYGAFWFLAGFAVNLLGKGSAVNALVLVGLWAFLALLMPAMVNAAAGEIHPVPSRVSLVTAMRGAENEAREIRDELLAQYYNDHPELTEDRDQDEYERNKAFFVYYQRMFMVGEAVARDVSPTVGRFNDQMAAQQGFERGLAFLSPMVMMDESMNLLSGVSSRQYLAYGDAARSFSTEWHGYFKDKAHRGQMISSNDLDQFPKFQFEAPGLQGMMMTYGLVILIFAGILLFLAWQLRGNLMGTLS